MDMKPATATNGKVPQQTVHVFESEGVTFTSQFDSGNLGRVELTSPSSFSLWTVPDCFGSLAESSCRSWFHFRVVLSSPRSLTFTVKNLNLQGKMYREGMKPVVKTPEKDWGRVPGSVSYSVAGEVATLFEITFGFEFEGCEAAFAFTYPWSYTDNEQFLSTLRPVPSIFYHRTTLIHTLEGRKCEILTISSPSDLPPSPPPPYPRPMVPAGDPTPLFQTSKSVVFISSRVHPGETPASFMLNGFLQWVLSGDPRAVAARDRFVFIIVPMLNPDGVARGHYRLDTRGNNLNRSYGNPEPGVCPTIWAVKEVIGRVKGGREGLYAYVDLHAHASKRGIFVYGNSMDFWRTVTAHSFARLLSLNHQFFDYPGSIFDEENMKAKEPRDKQSKEGCGRVAVYTATGLPLCFTLEANFNSGPIHTVISESGLGTDIEDESRGVQSFDIPLFESVGRALGVSLLDSCDANPFSRLGKAGFPSFNELKTVCAEGLAATPAYRGDVDLRTQVRSKERLVGGTVGKKGKLGSWRPPKPRGLRRYSHSKAPSIDPGKEGGG